jgi:hypothetical protein
MMEIRIWHLKWGRISSGTAIIGANSFDAAIDLAMGIIREQKPDWNATKEDIISLTRTDDFLYIGNEATDAAS